ncbi:MAG: purine-nucleoside phosphorylase [Cryomorphaceae bacterium]
MELSYRIQETTQFIEERMQAKGALGVVLGTGLGGFADELEIEGELKYADIPHFPQSTVEGHDGKLIFGSLNGQTILAMKGRFHFYEGYQMEAVAYPIRVMHSLGIDTILLSNASGGVNPEFQVGDIMLIKDHINLFPTNPLIGANDDSLGPRFPDMSEPYDADLREMIKNAAAKEGIRLHEGVYAGVTGPCFETPAEYKYLRIIGADTVGMSTVPETIAAKHLGMRVMALSVITDLGIEGQVESVSHEEVQAAAQAAEPKVASLVRTFLSSFTQTSH